MIYENRQEAGKVLAEALKNKIHYDDNPIIIAIPRGGIPVAFEVSKALKVPMTVVVSRKLGLPWNEEAGFGAIDPDGDVYLDQNLLNHAKLDKEVISEISKRELSKLREREKKLAPRGYPDLKKREVIIVDDGIATGYTAIATAGFTRKRGAKRITVAVPVCPRETSAVFKGKADEFLCVSPSSEFSFAVGMFYKDFRQITDQEAVEYIQKADKEGLYEPPLL